MTYDCRLWISRVTDNDIHWAGTDIDELYDAMRCDSFREPAMVDVNPAGEHIGGADSSESLEATCNAHDLQIRWHDEPDFDVREQLVNASHPICSEDGYCNLVFPELDAYNDHIAETHEVETAETIQAHLRPITTHSAW